MDDVQIFPSSDYRQEKISFMKIFLIIIALVSATAGVAVISYFLGAGFSDENKSNYNQTLPIQTPEPTFSEETASPTPIEKKLSPTQKLSPTSTPTPTPLLKTKILKSIASLDGFRSSNGGGNNLLEIRAGRNSSLVTRGFVSFEISEIPADSVIQSATIKLYQTKVVGNPYIAGGSLMLDHLTYGETLDDPDYAFPALSTNFTTLSKSATPGWKEVDVTARFKDDLANARSLSQYRIHFQNEITGGNTTGDFVYFEAQENTLKTGNTPQLVVKYY